LNAGETGELGNRFSSFLEPREETEVEGGEASLRSNSSAGGTELVRIRWQRLNGRKRRRAFGKSVLSHLDKSDLTSVRLLTDWNWPL